MKRFFNIVLSATALTFATVGTAPSASLFATDYTFTYYPPYVHNLFRVSALHDTLETDDRSVWRVNPLHAYKVGYWYPDDPLVITQNYGFLSYFSNYRYLMWNEKTGEYIETELQLGPDLDGQKTRWIINMDYATKTIILNNGQHYGIIRSDNPEFSKWKINDIVIIGKNAGNRQDYESILVNVTVNNFVRAKQY